MPFLKAVAKPFVFALNAIPRVAVILIIVMIVPSDALADAFTAFTVVVFLVFFNAFEGGSTLPQELVQNARLLGANSVEVMYRVRWPVVLSWIFASLPNAISFGLVGSVTAELFTGSDGIGQLLTTAVDTSNATLTFALVFLLTLVGVLLVLGTQLLRGRALRWRETPA